VQKRLNSLIGLTSPEEESLLRTLSYLADKGKKLSGVIENLDIDKIKADAEITAQINRFGTIYNIIINGRPKALTGAYSKKIFEGNFDASQPLFDHSTNDSQGQMQIRKRLKEIIYILGYLV